MIPSILGEKDFTFSIKNIKKDTFQVKNLPSKIEKSRNAEVLR